MSSNKKLAKEIVKNSIEIRRELQYEEMCKWDRQEITGVEAIENIVNIEKVIWLNARDKQEDPKNG